MRRRTDATSQAEEEAMGASCHHPPAIGIGGLDHENYFGAIDAHQQRCAAIGELSRRPSPQRRAGDG